MAYMPELYMNTTQREAGVAPHFAILHASHAEPRPLRSERGSTVEWGTHTQARRQRGQALRGQALSTTWSIFRMIASFASYCSRSMMRSFSRVSSRSASIAPSTAATEPTGRLGRPRTAAAS